MRRTLVALGLVVGLFAFPSSASATHDLLGFQSAVDAMLAVDPTLDPPPNDGRHDFVVAGVQAGTGSLAVSAHSGPSGEEPFGHISETISDAPGDEKQHRWRVTCVNVAANLAAITGVATRTSDTPHGRTFLFRDGGPQGGTPLNPDSVAYTGAASPDDCLNPAHLAFAAIISPLGTEHGNVLVHDAQP
jgi:hypothetical protein